jgi:hypothetical protein
MPAVPWAALMPSLIHSSICISPTFSLRFAHSVPILCGLFAQNAGAEAEAGLRRDRDCLSDVMLQLMPRNLSIIGNCIGLRSDLQRAIDDYAAGVLPVRIDSVFRDDGAAFVDRTYNDTDRVGKVIWRYC